MLTVTIQIMFWQIGGYVCDFKTCVNVSQGQYKSGNLFLFAQNVHTYMYHDCPYLDGFEVTPVKLKIRSTVNSAPRRIHIFEVEFNYPS